MDTVGLPARSTDPHTSHEGRSTVKRLNQQRRNILDLHAAYGPLLDEKGLALYRDRYGKISPSGYRTRRSEIVVAGFIVDTKRVKVMVSGRKGILWDIA